jgi:hypothetical protein
MKRLALGALVLAVGFAGLVAFALESGEVAVLRTGPEVERETRVWVAEAEGAVWLEAATPERAWYQDVLSHPELILERPAATHRYRATPQPGAEGHARIRGLLRQKYGWTDSFVGLLQDTSRSVAVRLERID